MAYAAVISLKHTLEHLQKSSRISLVPPSLQIIKSAYKEVVSLKEILKRLDESNSSSRRERVNVLDQQIRVAVCELEDVLESHLSKQIAAQFERRRGGIQFSIDLQHIQQNFVSFTDISKKMEEECLVELDNPLPSKEDVVPSTIDFGGKKSKMVGLSDQLSFVKHWATIGLRKLEVIVLVGMAGIGKTTVAREIFEDPYVSENFHFRAWVTVGRNCQLKQILRCILAKVNHDKDEIRMEGDEKEADQYLRESLKGKRYLIVLDDLWDIKIWHGLESCLPNDENGSRVLLTSRLQKIGPIPIKLRNLNEKESWDLLREKVFAEKVCPAEFERAGKMIAKKCEGHPLTIVTVADLLRKGKPTPEYWSEVAAQQEHPLFIEAYDEISTVISSSYEYLPTHLKVCFLYMGVFPQNYDIRPSVLFNLWSSEAILESERFHTIEYCAEQCFEELVSNSLVTVYTHRIFLRLDEVKTCRLHPSFRHLCKKVAGKNKFFHILNSRANGLAEGIKSQYRLCIYNNVLFGLKDVYDSIKDNCAATARSLLCFGPYHQYQVQVCFSLRLLRVLDARTVRLYEFPQEVLELVQLRHLALTCNGKLPTSISKLWNLQIFIVLRHLSINTCGAPPKLPMEIWDMKELKHLQIVGNDLPDPGGASLENLLTLLNVSAHSCTEGILKAIPNLQKLGIQIELAPDVAQPLRCFSHISALNELKTLKCVVMNPQHIFKVVAPPASFSNLPSWLRKLSLSGLGYPWKEINSIASLKYLKILKLRNYAFRGPKWEIDENGFMELRSLVIEDSDLEQWKVGCGSFRMLDHLSIRQCYKLEEFHWKFLHIVEKIELVDSNPLLVTRIKEINAKWSRGGPYFEHVNVRSSWEEGK